MKKLTSVAFLLTLMVNMSGQNPYLVLTYTAEDNGTYLQLDSLKVMNRSQDCDTILHWPDTVLVLGSNVGMHEGIIEDGGLQVFQNYPNPVVDHTTIKMYVPADGLVSIIITDVTGRTVYQSEQVLEQGYHSFRYVPISRGMSFFTATLQGMVSSIRVMSMNPGVQVRASVEYIGNSTSQNQLKESNMLQDFTFSFGDTLLYIGYAEALESGILEMPMTHDTSTFQFAYNIPCPGTPTVEYEGQTYNTLQIFNHCWLKENLNVGIMIQGDEQMTDNGIIEKYCYNNQADSCKKFGGLYLWPEMMKYNPYQGVQGICPQGWHIPRDEEWKLLEGAADSQYGIGDPEWDKEFVFRGFDAHENLKSTSGWYWVYGDCSGNNHYGFSSLPGGRRTLSTFYGIGYYCCWLTYNHHDQAYTHAINCNKTGVGRGRHIFNLDKHGFSVRCIKD